MRLPLAEVTDERPFLSLPHRDHLHTSALRLGAAAVHVTALLRSSDPDDFPPTDSEGSALHVHARVRPSDEEVRP